jgi:hypothetical protein
MNWSERETDSFKQLPVTPERIKELEKSRAEGQPVIEKEADRGQLPFNGIKFQPVKSPGLYEAEFAKKDKDLIFHFWPYGHHSAQRRGIASPRFPQAFAGSLATAMEKEFGKSVRIEFDRDLTSYFVRVEGWGERQFFRELAISACEKLHGLLGGSPGRDEG